MNDGRKALYAALGIVAAAVMAMLLAFTLTKLKGLLYAALALFAVLCALFTGTAVLAKKTGWKGERTLRARVLSDERFLLDLYAPEKGRKNVVRADVYPPSDPDHTIALLGRLSRDPNASDADMGTLGELCVGSVELTEAELVSLKNKLYTAEDGAYELLLARPALGKLHSHLKRY